MTGDTFPNDYTNIQERLKRGEEEALRQIFDEYWERLLTYAFRIYEDEKICEDIVQEIFIKLWERREGPTILNLEGYLFKSVKYAIANRIRDLKLNKVQVDVLEKISVSQNPQQHLEYKEFEKRTLLLIEELPPKCKEIFKLSRFEHLSNAEISEKMDISVRTVETHISQALKSLRKNFPDSQVSIFISLLLLYC